MTDIVERLRKLDEVVTFDGPWLREAADEIERLRDSQKRRVGMNILSDDTYQHLRPTYEQLDLMQNLRDSTTRYSGILETNLPDGADKDHILRLLRTLAMWIDVCITRNEDGSPRT